jgi:alkylation response protein AidB-like acyl-CoA dehydrogenase
MSDDANARRHRLAPTPTASVRRQMTTTGSVPVKPVVRFRLDDAQAELRDSVRSWLDEHLPDEFRRSAANADYLPEAAHRRAVRFCRGLHEQGWFVPHWPAAYEGGGRSTIDQIIIREQLAYHGAPLVNSNGVNMLAPILFVHGTDEQKEQHLAPIARSEVMWAQGYSEPDAGSDLASLRMTARRAGDHYVLSGQKTWTSNGRLADWIFVLARSDPDAPKPQAGLSFLLVDCATPGIAVRPIRSLTGYSTFAEEFFDDVEVPVANRVGPEHDGWRIAKALLDVERSNITRAAQCQRFLDELVEWCRAREGATDDPLREPLNRAALADLALRLEVGRALCYRIAQLQSQRSLSPTHASLAKLYHAELAVELRSVGARILGAAGVLMPDDPHVPVHGHYSEGLLLSLLHRIGGGTSEIQRDVIARGLGLPR